MTSKQANLTKDFYNNSYATLGIKAQRRYPNEEFCRFMGRNFLDKNIPFEERKNIRILETGCGSGANLWMIAREGFDAHGIDLSIDGIELAREMLVSYNVSANLSVQDMSNLDFPENYFDAVVDVFSSYCLNKTQGEQYIKSVNSVLKPGGLFFSYFPSKKSESYQFPGDAKFVDSDTLDGITRRDSPFCGQNYPFRFMHSREYEQLLTNSGFDIKYSEIADKTYRRKQELFSFVVVEARKI